MKNILSVLFIFIFAFSINIANAQEDMRAKEIIEQRIEELSSKADMEFDFTEIYEYFLNLYENPIDVNSANEDELRKLLFLNDNQIAILIEERRKIGGFKTIYELKDLEGFNTELILNIQPFIVFNKIENKRKLKLKSMLKYGKNQVILRYGRVIENQAGYMPIEDSVLAMYPNRRYLGSKDKVYLRYRYRFSDILSFGVLGDKDAGEEFFSGNNKKGFDFYSAHFFIKNRGNLKALAIGDYHLEFGQGLTMWSGLAFGKSATTISLQRQARGLRANTSANEVLFFRGAAATYGISKSIDITAFYSNKGLDAGLNALDTSDTEDLVFSTIQESGMHRTPSELAKKNAVNEQVFGANAQYRKRGLRLGITAFQTIYDKELLKDAKPYQYYDFNGRKNFNAGFNASYANKYLSIFGEAAMSKNKGKALIIGTLFNLHPRLTMTILYRNYQKEYQNFYAIALAEGGKAKNEEGLYFGANIRLGSKNNIVLYYDLFKFPWLKYRVNTPSFGSEFSAQYARNVDRHFNYYVRYKYEEKMLNVTDDDISMREVNTVNKSNFRFHLSYKVSRQLKLQSRLTLSSYHQQPLSKSKGYLLYQDIQYAPKKIPIKFTFRYAVFNTDNYDSRIYAYEHNVLYKFSVPPYMYKGQRYYILLSYKMNRALSFWLHYSQTIYSERKSISSGLEEIEGNTRSEITAQLRWKF